MTLFRAMFFRSFRSREKIMSEIADNNCSVAILANRIFFKNSK